jgi:GDPmannose 4,6-dehydratase
MSFAEVGVGIEFRGENEQEKGYISSVNDEAFSKIVGSEHLDKFKKRIGETVVGVDPAYFRPTEVDILIGDNTKARTKLGWEPTYDLKSLCQDMVIHDIELMKKEEYLKNGGYRILNYFE